MTTAIISAKGWVVIPAELRKKYDLQPGARVMVVDYGGVLALVPALDSPIAASAGLLKKGRARLTQALLAEKAQKRARESRTRHLRAG